MCIKLNFRISLLVLTAVLPHVRTISVRRRPSDVFVNAGDTAEISCDVDHRNVGTQIIGWMHVNSGQFISYGRQILPSLDADKRSRYSITGSIAADVYTLRISGVSDVDNGTYKCGYYSAAGQYTPLVQAVLTVRRLSTVDTFPQCRFAPVSSSNPSQLGVGDMVDFICSWNGDPSVIGASWASNGKLLNTRMENQYVWTRKQLAADDNGQNFTCTLRTSAGQQSADPPRTCNVSPFRVPPSAMILPESAIVNVGESVEFTCQGHGIPGITSYKWLTPSRATERLLQGYHDADQRRVQMLTNNVLRITDIRREDDGTRVSCQVQIPSGMSATATAILRVRNAVTTSNGVPTPTITTSSSKIRNVDDTEDKNPPNAPASTMSVVDTSTDITDKPADVTHKNSLSTLASFSTPYSKHGYTTGVLGDATVQTFNKNITIALGVAGLILLILLILTIIISSIKCSRNNRQHMKLENGQLPIHVVNDSYGQLLSSTAASSPEDKTYEEVTTVVTVRMTPLPTPTPPPPPSLNNKNAKKTCPIYATPNKLKRNSSPAASGQSKVQYANMPSDGMSIYDTPPFGRRPSTPPPPPPPPKYEDVALPPTVRRHRPLGPAKSCSTFSRSTYSSLASEDEFCESPDVVNAIRANHMKAFTEETNFETENKTLITDSDRSNDLIEDEYVQLELPGRKSRNVEGLQYADLDLNENVGSEVRPPECPTEYARITSTPL